MATAPEDISLSDFGGKYVLASHPTVPSSALALIRHRESEMIKALKNSTKLLGMLSYDSPRLSEDAEAGRRYATLNPRTSPA